MQRVLIDVRDDITMKVKIINLSQYSSISEVSIKSYNILHSLFLAQIQLRTFNQKINLMNLRWFG